MQPPATNDRGLGARTMRASAWLIGGFTYQRVAQLVAMMVLARMLVPADFGLVALATTLLLSLMSLTELSLANALIHEREPTRDDYDTAFTFGALRGVLLSLAMVAGGVAMAAIYNDGRLFAITAALGLKPLLNGLASPRYVTLSRNLSFGRITAMESLAATGQVLVSVLVAALTRSYWAIVVGVLVASMIGLGASYRYAPYRPRLSVAAWRKLMSFSIWMTLNQIASVVGNRFDNFLAGGLLGTAVFGAYSVGNNIAGLMTQSAMQPLERALFPSFTKIVDDRERLKSAFQRAQACLLAIGLPVGVGLALVAQPFVHAVLGPNWGVAALVIEVIAPVLALQIVFGPQNALAYSLGATRTVFHRSLVQIAFRIPIVIAGLYFFGLVGLLVARALSGGVMVSIINMLMVRKLIGIGPLDQLIVAWRSLVSAAAMAAVLILAESALPPIGNEAQALATLALLVPLGALAYGVAHFGLWLMAGRPDGGIEREIVAMAGRLRARLAMRATEAAGTRG